MKQKLLFALCLMTMAINASAQKSVTRESVVAFESTEARMLDVMSKAIFKPLVVELELAGSRTEKVYEVSRELLESMSGNVENLQNYATFKMSQDLKCDVIVAATYDVQYNSVAGKGTVTIIGYPANFKNWHSVNDTDLKWITTLPTNLYTTPTVTTVSNGK